MKPSSKKCHATTKVTCKREDKKGINIRWNSGVFFQVGLIVGLIAMLLVMEIKVGQGQAVVKEPHDGIWDAPQNVTFVLEKDVVVEPPKPPKAIAPKEPRTPVQPLSNTFIEVPDYSKVDESSFTSEEEPAGNEPSVPSDPSLPTETKSMINVEFVPVFPGCEGMDGNTAKIECMGAKIRAFIGKEFNTEKFDYFKPGSEQKIYTMFTINAEGNIVDIKARAADNRLQAEAQRVIEKLPLMTPGKQGNKAVNVTYSVPINFKINY